MFIQFSICQGRDVLYNQLITCSLMVCDIHYTYYVEQCLTLSSFGIYVKYTAFWKLVAFVSSVLEGVILSCVC
jgi:hypothetical protein